MVRVRNATGRCQSPSRVQRLQEHSNWSHWGSVGPCPGPCFITTSRLWCWITQEKARHVLAVLQGQTINILQSIHIEASVKTLLRHSETTTGITNWS
jgi:hypothetical protein